MRLGSSAYRDLFRLQAVRSEALAGLLAQVTQGGGAIGLILVVRAHSGSFALAGAVVGALSLAAGVARPIQGRLIDRRGAGPLMAGCGVVHAAALIGIVALAGAPAPGALLVLLGALAGAALPPVSTTMRVVWGAVVADSERTAAYSLVFLVQELSILVGPLVLSGVIAVADASAALIVLAVIACVGTVGLAVLATGAVRDRAATATAGTTATAAADATAGTDASAGAGTASAGATRGWLPARQMRVVVALALLTGGVIGAVEVAVPTASAAAHDAAASGLLIACLSVGGISGAVVYGSGHWTVAVGRRLLLLLAGLTVAVSAMVAVDSLIVLGLLLLAAGLALNPVLTTISLLADESIAAASTAEAFGWISFGLAGGGGGASAIAGALAHAGNPHTAFLVGAVAGACATLLAAAARAKARK